MNRSWYLPAPSSRFRVVIGCTGSVATIKVPELARKLKDCGCDVLIVPTEAACHFLACQEKVEEKNKAEANIIVNISDKRTIDNNSSEPYKKDNMKYVTKGECSESAKNGAELNSLFPDLEFVVDQDEWISWKGRGDPVVHIELRKWAQLLLLAPLDANTLAKLACGICDNLLTSIVRAWDPARPVLFCPAMNTFMYQHPHTAKHIAAIKELGMIEIPVICKTLVCGDTGPGAMAEVSTIIDAVLERMVVNTKND